MEKQNDKYKTFSRRAVLIGGGQLLLMGGLTARLAQLQIAKADQYKVLSDRNRIDLRLIPPSRGIIYDRRGIILARNEQNFRLLMTAEQVRDIDSFIAELQRHILLSEAEVAQLKERIAAVPSFIPVEIKDRLDWETVSKIEVHLPDLPGVQIDVGEYRVYPFEEEVAHVLGYVSAVSKEDLRRSGEQLLRLPGMKTGKVGIERTYEKNLRGRAGTKKIEVNVAGREVRELERIKALRGDAVILTIDHPLQKLVQEQLSQHKSAASIVMDAQNGAIYALGSHPNYDNNLFSSGMSAQTWQSLLSDPTFPLTNKAVAGQYPPGSTFKMITALAGLEAGEINEHTKVSCPGHYDLGSDRFHCWKRGGHGAMDLVEALSQSCDVYFYDLATKIGIDRIYETALRFGLGEKLDFDLREERPGLIPNSRWKLGHIGRSWQKGETVVASIGQGYMQSTPLQLATMCARLVNGGKAVKPWLTHRVGPFYRPTVEPEPMDVSAKHLALIKRGMDRAVNHVQGTAHRSRLEGMGVDMGGKTGTAQVRRITQRQREEGIDQESMAWRSRHHALFLGYAPLDKPRYVCATVVEHGIGGSTTAAPLTREIMKKTLQQDPASKAPYVGDLERAKQAQEEQPI